MSIKVGKGSNGEDLIDCDGCSKAKGKGKRSMNVFQGRHLCKQCYAEQLEIVEANRAKLNGN